MLCYYSAAVLGLLCIVSFSDLAYYYHYYGQLVSTPTHSSHERHCKNNNNNYTAMSVRRSESVYEISEQMDNRLQIVVRSREKNVTHRHTITNVVYVKKCNIYILLEQCRLVYILVSEQYHVHLNEIGSYNIFDYFLTQTN